MKKKLSFCVALFCMLLTLGAAAQTPCASLLTDDYISDGQYYTATIHAGESKNCEITFIEGNEYRIIVCPHSTEKIRMQLIDQQNNILFDNKNYSYTNYWNFAITNTFSCTIKLTIDDKNVQSDDVVLLVGFKK
ncbi:MAG: hypothetical protein MJ197_04435 [Bacteroidales bacterium]|nr:hypothetical protein [Bacteroidales bacterium]